MDMKFDHENIEFAHGYGQSAHENWYTQFANE